jgi:hypothetical protein
LRQGENFARWFLCADGDIRRAGNPAEQVNAFVTLAYVLLLGGVVGPNTFSIIATA